MSNNLQNRLAIICALALFGSGTFLLAQVKVGSEIEVREGDSWTKVKVLGTEGRRVRVQYPDGNEEWVGPDRIKPANGSTAAPVKPVETNSTTPPSNTAKPASRIFSINQQVEIKRNAKWFAAKIQQVAKGWVFVVEEEDTKQVRWVESWAVRVAGSAYEIDEDGTNSQVVGLGQIVPKEQPAKAPSHLGDQFAVATEDQKIPTKEELLKNFETLSFENSQSPVASSDHVTHVTTTQPLSAEFTAWALRGSDNRLDDIVLCPGSMKTAVASFPGGFGRSTVVIRTGILGHNQLDTRSLFIPDVKVLAAANEGDLLLSVVGGDHNIQFWKWGGTNYKLAANLRADAEFGGNISSAQFVSSDKAVVATSNGSILLVDLVKKQALSSIKSARNSKVFYHPSGQLIGFYSESNTAILMRTSDFSIVNEFDNAEPKCNISVDSAGLHAAYLTTTGKLRVVKIEDGSEIGQISLGANFNGQIDLVDEKFILVDRSIAYEVKSGLPVWQYKMPFGVIVKPLINGQFIIAFPGNKMASIAVANIPDQVGKIAVKTATADKFILSPGKVVKVDSDFAFFPNDREKAIGIVEDQLKLAGLKTSEQADEAFHLKFDLVGGPTTKREYAPDIFTPPDQRTITSVDVPSNILTVTLTYKGEAVWTREIRYEAGSMIQRNKDQSFQDVCTNAAIPKPDRLKELNFPSYLPVGAKPGAAPALGSSTLQDRKFAPDKPAAPAKP